jgi:type VI secretion system protein ImpL
LLAASFGAEWGGIGQTLFVQPLEQAWQRVLQPSAASLNTQWQRAVVDHWQSAFAGRFPFAPTASDASLPMLGQMIRSDSGRIEQFLREQLNGILRKEGDRWVADPRQSQGLRINPKFLAAINQLSHLADVLYTDGGMGMNFELSGKPVRDVVQTSFVLDGQKHHYFNQKEGWQRFKWPGLSPAPGAMLTWTSVHTGERLYGDYQGIWGLIRLFEQAKVTPLDDGDSRFKLTGKPDAFYLRVPGTPERQPLAAHFAAKGFGDDDRMADLPDGCFAIQGLAASQPLTRDDSEAGRATNRRVDIQLVPQAGACPGEAT